MQNFRSRLEDAIDEISILYKKLYGKDANNKLKGLFEVIEKNYVNRSDLLKKLDSNISKEWYMSNKTVAYTLYVDLFADNLSNLKTKIPYFIEMGINYIHILPIFKTSDEENDGGYSIADYKSIDPKVGTINDLKDFINELLKHEIYCCLDFVLNHTSKHHEWAIKAANGDKFYQSLYMMYDNYYIPSQFEKTVPEILPLIAPGNFTYYKSFRKWVFTSFNEYQWDVNYANPDLFNLIIENLLNIINTGVRVIRLDAIPYIWKDLGTDCRNRPMSHVIVQLIYLIVKIFSPGVILKGEAIVSSSEIVKYFGDEDKKECQIMYNATNMTLLWSTLATGNTMMLKKYLGEIINLPSNCTWMNYIRCHDDIGWDFPEKLLKSMNLDAKEFKNYLIKYYTGKLPQSDALGEIYELNPKTEDARISGTTASLCGVEKSLAQKNNNQLILAVNKIKLLYGIMLAQPGIPMIYYGDEVGTVNDWEYKNIASKRVDSRWLHRPKFNWELADLRFNNNNFRSELFSYFKNLIKIRKEYAIFSSDISLTLINISNPNVIAFKKECSNNKLVIISNFSNTIQKIALNREIIDLKICKDLISNRTPKIEENQMLIEPYTTLWMHS